MEMFTVIKEVETKFVENRSKFIGLIFFCDSIQKKDEILCKLKKEYLSANHICFAYAINSNESIDYFFSDDKEPSGTAGLQILNVLKEQNLVNTLGVVVRFFGGVKLGVQNLSKAYKDCFLETVINNKKEVVKKTKCNIWCDYNQFNKLKKKIEIDSTNISFDDNIKFDIFLDEKEIDYAKDIVNKIEVFYEKRYL